MRGKYSFIHFENFCNFFEPLFQKSAGSFLKIFYFFKLTNPWGFVLCFNFRRLFIKEIFLCYSRRGVDRAAFFRAIGLNTFFRVSALCFRQWRQNGVNRGSQNPYLIVMPTHLVRPGLIPMIVRFYGWFSLVFLLFHLFRSNI